MTTRTGRAWPIGGMPPMAKPVRSLASRAVARRMSGSPVTAARRARSTRFGPETRHDDRARARRRRRGDEDERLHDLAELARRPPRPPRRRCGSTRRRPRPRGSRPCGRRRRGRAGSAGWIERVGHGAESSIGLGSGPRSIARCMVALVLADGDVRDREPRSTPPGPAGSTPARSSSPPTAARATPSRSACAIDLWVGDGDSLEPRRLAALAAAGVPNRPRAPPDKDESDTELAVRRGARARRRPDRRPRRARRRAPRPRARQRRRCWRMPGSRSAGDGPPRRLGPGRARPRPGPDGRPVEPAAARARRRPRVAAAVRRRRRRRHDRRASLPAARRAAAVGAGARPVERPRRPPTRRSSSGAACCSSSRRPATLSA